MSQRFLQNSRGSVLADVIVSIGIGVTVLTLATASFLDVIRDSYDQKVIAKSEIAAQSLIRLIFSDLKVMGAGMPYGQANFSSQTPGAGDIPLILLPSSNDTFIEFRANDKGVHTVTTADYTPVAGQVATIPVLSTENLAVGKRVYISDMTSGGDAGYSSVIQNINGNNITLAGNSVATPGVTFPSGSAFSSVSTIRYNSPSAFAGATRQIDSGDSVLIGDGTAFAIEYLDRQGSSVALPLTTNFIENNLRALRITAFVRNPEPLKSGQFYTAQAAQTIALRNVILQNAANDPGSG